MGRQGYVSLTKWGVATINARVKEIIQNNAPRIGSKEALFEDVGIARATFYKVMGQNEVEPATLASVVKALDLDPEEGRFYVEPVPFTLPPAAGAVSDVVVEEIVDTAYLPPQSEAGATTSPANAQRGDTDMEITPALLNHKLSGMHEYQVDALITSFMRTGVDPWKSVPKSPLGDKINAFVQWVIREDDLEKAYRRASEPFS